MSTTQSEAPVAGIQVGDTVRIGRAQKLWRIKEFWTGAGAALARLESVDAGWSGTSAHVTSLVLVERPAS